jgi:hypothetical protein
MKKGKALTVMLIFVCISTLILPPSVYSQGQQGASSFKPEELNQLVAPIALYPDDLLTQILMASTYPLEIVQADRWAKQNKNLKGDALAKALEAQPWDPSVKSLVNFPDVLAMMSDKLDWTQKLGDAFLAQEKDVMETVQKLRAKAQASGNLKTTKEQVVKAQQDVIIIEPTNPNYIYVPAYNPTVVYGAWAYPAYPPYPVYPPGYVATSAAFGFVAGAAVGAAWGYAWGNANWHGGDVNVNVNKNANVNNNINRQKYQQQYQAKGGQAGQGKWQHDASHRGGVAYKDQRTAQQYNKGTSAQNRDAYRGKGDQGAGGRQGGQPGGDRAGASTMDRGGQKPGGDRAGASTMDRGGSQGAFGGMDKGSSARMESSRGQSSRQSAPSPSMQRSGRGGGGGGGRGGRR